MRTAADHLDMRLKDAYWNQWRRYDPLITRRKLFIRLVVDSRGLVADSALVTSTGVEDLDLAIEHWLRTASLGLPPIAPGTNHYLSATLEWR